MTIIDESMKDNKLKRVPEFPIIPALFTLVLFGLTMNQSLYFECIDASCLSEDIRLLVDNDLTEIGEHGVNLSGGQRARVAFARCLYHSKYNYKNDVDNGNNVAIFDDPLSAVDVDVAY